MNTDKKTIESYDKHGSKFASEYRSIQRFSPSEFNRIFQNCNRILEIGCGSGKDLAQLIACGFDAMALEPSVTFINEAQHHFPETSGRIIQASIPLSEQRLRSWKGKFDGIHCNAVIMHIPEVARIGFLKELKYLTKKGGIIQLVYSETRESLDSEQRDSYGRLYVEVPTQVLLQQCQQVGLKTFEYEDLNGMSFSRGKNWKRLILRN